MLIPLYAPVGLTSVAASVICVTLPACALLLTWTYPSPPYVLLSASICTSKTPPFLILVADTTAPKPSPPNPHVFAAPIVATSNVIFAAPPPPTKLSLIVIVSLIACPVPPLVTTTA